MEGIFIFAIVAVAFIVFAILGAMQAGKRRQALTQWATQHGLSFDPSEDSSITERFPDVGGFSQGSRRYAFNRIQGQWQRRPMLAFDYHYETHSTDSKGRRQTHHHYFSAVIIECEYPLKPLFLRPEGLFDKITEFFGFDDIDFESAKFSREFYVKSPDRRWAFDVLHQRTMQFLLDQPRFTLQFTGRHIVALHASTMNPDQFAAAAGVVTGVLDAFPDYLREQLLRPETASLSHGDHA